MANNIKILAEKTFDPTGYVALYPDPFVPGSMRTALVTSIILRVVGTGTPTVAIKAFASSSDSAVFVYGALASGTNVVLKDVVTLGPDQYLEIGVAGTNDVHAVVMGIERD